MENQQKEQQVMPLDLSGIVKKMNEIIEQTNKNSERISKLYEILAGQFKED